MANVVKVHPNLLRPNAGNTNPDERDRELVWRFEMDSPIIDIDNDVLSHSQCPKLFSFHPTVPHLFVVNLGHQTLEEHPCVVDVTIEYSNRYEGNDGSGQGSNGFTHIQNPLQRPAVIHMRSYKTREVIEIDEDKKPIVTTAGEPIIHEDEVTRRLITVSKNITGLDQIFATELDFMNQDAVTIYGVTFEPKTLWLTDINLSPIKWENGVFFFTLDFAMYHNPKTWLVKKRNAGYTHIAPVEVPGRNGQFVLRSVPIMVGNPERPTQIPLPLQNDPKKLKLSDFPTIHGLVHPDFQVLDHLKRLKSVNPDVQLTPARLKQIYKESELEFRTKKLIKFKGNVPLS